MASTVVIVFEVLFLVLICFGAFTGNLMLFILVAKIPALQTKGNVFILNLAAADLLVATVNMPITIVTVISDDWILGSDFCVLSGFLTMLTFVASCMALTMISVNRYHAIVHWTRYHEKYTSTKCVVYVVIVWSITIGLSMPPLCGWSKFHFDKGQSYCFAQWSLSKSYTLFMIAACLLGPVCIMSYCYFKIIRFKKESRRRVQTIAMSCDGTSNSLTAVNYTEPLPNQTQAVRSERKLTRTIMSLIVVFGLCWAPFAIIMLVEVFTGAKAPRAVDFGSLVLGYMNSFFNVFVYNATNKKIQHGYRRLLGLKTNQVDVGSRGSS